MDRTEQAGLGAAAAGHVVLFGLLSVGFLATPNPLKLQPPPMEVVLTDEVGLTSAAPDPSQEEPAPRQAEIEAPVVEPVPPPPAPVPEPQPAPRPEPRQPAPAPRPTPKPTPPKRETPRPEAARPKPAKPTPRETRPTGRLAGITDGLTDRPSTSTSTRPRTSQTAAQARKSIDVAIAQEIKPHWRPPTGADAEELVTVIELRLNRDGGLSGEPRLIEQRGRTASNQPQQQLHIERAIKAIKLAAPFNLPAEYYDQWKTWRLEFDARLTQ